MPKKIVYVTQSEYKRQENRLFCDQPFRQKKVRDFVEFDLREATIPEVLEVNLEEMVKHEVKAAYQRFRVPCIVEHAGLIFEDYESASYPGGLTKPMWNALGENFVKETQSSSRGAIARAVVAYCDGLSIHTFVGETRGIIAEAPKGDRQFYWDTIFIPRQPDQSNTLTYAEIASDARGVEHKVELSQSSKAMQQFVAFFLDAESSDLWR